MRRDIIKDIIQSFSNEKFLIGRQNDKHELVLKCIFDPRPSFMQKNNFSDNFRKGVKTWAR